MENYNSTEKVLRSGRGFSSSTRMQNDTIMRFAKGTCPRIIARREKKECQTNPTCLQTPRFNYSTAYFTAVPRKPRFTLARAVF